MFDAIDGDQIRGVVSRQTDAEQRIGREFSMQEESDAVRREIAHNDGRGGLRFVVLEQRHRHVIAQPHARFQSLVMAADHGASQLGDDVLE